MKRTFTLFAQLILFCSLLSAQMPQNGLIAYYPLDNNANDQSGNENHGTAHGINFISGGTGSIAQFLQTSYINVPDNNYFNFSAASGITITARVKQETRSNGYILIKMGPGGSSDDEYSLSVSEDGHVSGGFVQNSSNYQHVNSNTVLELNTWYDIILIWENNGNISLYIDGELDNSVTSSVTSVQNTNVPLIIGDPNMNAPHSLIGSIEDIYIYNRVLSAGEISEFSIYELPTNSISSIIEDCMIFPNPIIDNLRISLEQGINYFDFKIIDLNGRIIKSGNNENNDVIDLSSIKTGSYILILNMGNKVYEHKIIKQ